MLVFSLAYHVDENYQFRSQSSTDVVKSEQLNEYRNGIGGKEYPADLENHIT